MRAAPSSNRNFLGIANDQLGRVEQHDDVGRHAGADEDRHGRDRRIAAGAEVEEAGAGLFRSESASLRSPAPRKYGAFSGLPLLINSANSTLRSADEI